MAAERYLYYMDNCNVLQSVTTNCYLQFRVLFEIQYPLLKKISTCTSTCSSCIKSANKLVDINS